MRVERTVKIRAVAGRKKAAHPDVEFGSLSDFRDCVQHVHGVRGSVVIGVKHELEPVRDWAVHVKSNIIELKLIGFGAATRFGGYEVGSQPGADRNRAEIDVCAHDSWRHGKKPGYSRKQSGGTTLRKQRTLAGYTYSRHE